MRCLFVSNGYGEDGIACTLALAFLAHDPAMEVMGYPVVGVGAAYEKQGLTCLVQNRVFPSGGFIRSLGDLFGDLKAGLLGHVWRMRSELKRYGGSVDMIVVVGDVFALMMARSLHCPVLFFPTAKSELFMAHSFLERWAIRRWAVCSFPRDQVTTDVFVKQGLPARFFGNPMMDDLGCDRRVFETVTGIVVGLLPGSRDEGMDNFLYFLQVCQRVAQLQPGAQFCCAFPQSLSLEVLKERCDWKFCGHEKGVVILDEGSGIEVVLTTDFLAVINQADVVLGLAGTANEQAVHVGTPVVCFPGFGPQSSVTRFREQKQLLGELLTVCETQDVDEISGVLCQEVGKKKRDVELSKTSASAAIVGFVMGDVLGNVGARGGT